MVTKQKTANKTKKNTKNSKGISTTAVVGIGASIAAVTAASYLLFGPEGKHNRKVVKGWAVKMKGEIIEGFEKAKDLTAPVYHNIIDAVHKKYSKVKNMDQQELEKLVKEAKNIGRIYHKNQQKRLLKKQNK